MSKGGAGRGQALRRAEVARQRPLNVQDANRLHSAGGIQRVIRAILRHLKRLLFRGNKAQIAQRHHEAKDWRKQRVVRAKKPGSNQADESGAEALHDGLLAPLALVVGMHRVAPLLRTLLEKRYWKKFFETSNWIIALLSPWKRARR